MSITNMLTPLSVHSFPCTVYFQVNPDRNLSFVEMLPFLPNPAKVTSKSQGSVGYPIGECSSTLFKGGKNCAATKKVDATPVRICTGEKRAYECSACGFRRVTRAAIQAHINKDHDVLQTKKKCACGFQAFNYDDFNQHKKRCRTKLECKICGYETTKRSSMNTHLKTIKHLWRDMAKGESVKTGAAGESVKTGAEGE